MANKQAQEEYGNGFFQRGKIKESTISKLIEFISKSAANDRILKSRVEPIEIVYLLLTKTLLVCEKAYQLFVPTSHFKSSIKRCVSSESVPS